MIPVLFTSPEECCACRACSNICPKGAISFVEDRYGFWFPSIDGSLCVHCGRCVSVCNFHSDATDFRKAPIKSYAATLCDKARIKDSTSGGVFFAMAEWIISKGGCVFGCVWDADMNAVHVCAESMEQVLPMQGSKYVQSNVGNAYIEVMDRLLEDRFVLFSGTPCQVAALKSYLGDKEYEKLFTLDLICHGVPNNRFFHQYLSFLEKRYGGKVTDFHFRHKKPDWLNGCVWMEIKRGKRRLPRELMYVESPYSKMYSGRNQCSRLSCSHCKYACTQRVGDMTIGDFWGYRKEEIGFDYRDGLSCVIVNHPKVLPILNELKLIMQEVPCDSVINGNTHLRRPSCKDEKWEMVMGAFASGGFEVLAREYYRNNSQTVRKARFDRKRKALEDRVKRFVPARLLSLYRKF